MLVRLLRRLNNDCHEVADVLKSHGIPVERWHSTLIDRDRETLLSLISPDGTYTQ